MKADRMVATAICAIARLITGVRATWRGNSPTFQPRIYFANHRSHGDFLLIWASLPDELRRLTRPVAAADYWLRGPLRGYLITKVFRGVTINRSVIAIPPPPSPIPLMGEALAAGQSLIMFPEGTRNTGDELLPFKSGIYHLAKNFPDVELVPVWIENLGRVMPKGEFVPVPLLCTLTFGPSLRIAADEPKETFLGRARDALMALAPLAA
jgi:1-acyl-sn-glycerol-3-phosphate acyltransferase